MAIPKTLNKLDTDKTIKLINKHLNDGTGEFEIEGEQHEWNFCKRFAGDFCYGTSKYHTHLIRQNFRGDFEGGKISN